MIKTYTLQFLFLCVSFHAFSQNNLDADIASVEQKVIEWRHYFHENPETRYGPSGGRSKR